MIADERVFSKSIRGLDRIGRKIRKKLSRTRWFSQTAPCYWEWW